MGSGVWLLKRRNECGAHRCGVLFNFLEQFHARHPVDAIACENVSFSRVTHGLILHAKLLGVVEQFTFSRGIPVSYYAATQVKKFATGKGNADKAAMLSAARRRWKWRNVTSDDEADALWIWALHKQMERRNA